MARARRVATDASETATTVGGGSATSALTCPECGRTFDRPAALGAHRRRAHGVPGASASSARSDGSRTRTTRRQRASSRKTQSTRSSRSRTRQPTQSATNGARRINRDALLSTLFPSGMPPRVDVMRAVDAWLDEADRISRIA